MYLNLFTHFTTIFFDAFLGSHQNFWKEFGAVEISSGLCIVSPKNGWSFSFNSDLVASTHKRFVGGRAGGIDRTQ